MRRGAQYLLGAALLAATASGAYFWQSDRQEKRAIADLIERTRAEMVFVEGGQFRMGNYQTQFRAPDGTVEEGWAAGGASVAMADVTLENFYLSAFETDYADFTLFLVAQDFSPLKADTEYRRYLPDRAASMSFEEATKYCAWLGQKAGLQMRLPTEAEWEYAARSRGLTPLWATDDGNYEPGRNIVPEGRELSEDERDPPVGSYPPNPLGLYNLADGLYEWVSDRAPTDPEGAAVYKGGSNASDRFYERIPDRGIAERRTEEALESLLAVLKGPEKERILRHDDPLSPGGPSVTARCVAIEIRPPAVSGFGQAPGPVMLSPPYHGNE